jgi:hypothetical protein
MDVKHLVCESVRHQESQTTDLLGKVLKAAVIIQIATLIT